MKTIRVICIILILLTIASCTMNKLVTKEVMLLVDITDKQLAEPSPEEILSFYSFAGKDKWNGAIFLHSHVSDISLNKTHSVQLPEGINWLSNELEREKQVNAFQKQVSNIVEGSRNDPSVRAHSSVYLSLARALNTLAASKADEKILVVYSDLMEHSSDLSFYRKSELNLLVTDSDSIQKIFDAWTPLAPLHGIEVHLLYQPRNINADRGFRIVSSFYKTLLEGKGASVLIEANIQKSYAQ